MKYLVAALFVLLGVAFGQEQHALSLKEKIDLPNVNGRIDHLSADVKGHRIFVSALGNGTVEELDVQSGKRLHSTVGLAEPQGVYYDASTNRLFVACGGDGTVKLFDAATAQLLATASFSGDADNLRYDTRRRRIIVGFGDGGLGFLDPNGKKTGEIVLDGHPESFQLERTGTRAFVNVPDAREIEMVDLVKDAVLSKLPVTSALSNFPMALDEAHHRLFIGCRKPARMLALDTATGKQTASIEIVGDTDDLFYDASKSRVYVIGGAGFVEVFEENDATHYSRVARLPTAPGARTGLFVAEWGELFIAVPHRGQQGAQILVYTAN